MRIIIPLLVFVFLFCLVGDASAQLFRGRFQRGCVTQPSCNSHFPARRILPCRAPCRYLNCASQCERFLPNSFLHYECVMNCHHQHCHWLPWRHRCPACDFSNWHNPWPNGECDMINYNSCVLACPPNGHFNCVNECARDYCPDVLR